MIAAGLVRNGGDLGGLTLNVSNVTVDPTAAGLVPAGDYVALTIRGRGDFRPETTWTPDRDDAPVLVSPDLAAAARGAGARLGYTRVLSADGGSITVFLPRFRP